MWYNGYIFPGSSMVEQEAVNFEVAGSSPVPGAIIVLADYFLCYNYVMLKLAKIEKILTYVFFVSLTIGVSFAFVIPYMLDVFNGDTSDTLCVAQGTLCSNTYTIFSMIGNAFLAFSLLSIAVLAILIVVELVLKTERKK